MKIESLSYPRAVVPQITIPSTGGIVHRNDTLTVVLRLEITGHSQIKFLEQVVLHHIAECLISDVFKRKSEDLESIVRIRWRNGGRKDWRMVDQGFEEFCSKKKHSTNKHAPLDDQQIPSLEQGGEIPHAGISELFSGGSP